MAEYSVYEDEKHHLGIVSMDGKFKSSAVYDEIQTLDNQIWHCRAYNDWDYFYPSTATFSAHVRCPVELDDGRRSSNELKPISVECREFYDSIPELKKSRFVYTYVNGKFGLKSISGSVILKPVYDDLNVWKNADVIQVRQADRYMYFNCQQQQILTDEPEYPEQGAPYVEGMGCTKMVAREIVDGVLDNHTYKSDAGYVRINSLNVEDVANKLQANCERIPMRQEAIELLTNRYSYEFGLISVRLKADEDGVVSDLEWQSAADRLIALCTFANSWHYIDKFMTNSRTRLSFRSFYWLKHKYDMECQVIGRLCFAYGIDETLRDGEVKWIHVEHYNEHCFPGPEDYAVSYAMEYGSIKELRRRLDACDWKGQGASYGGSFFGYHNIRYPKGRTWKETKKILDYMYELGHKPEDLLVQVVDNINYGFDRKKELRFWEQCADWALEKCGFPNLICNGQTCYDRFLDVNIDKHPKDIRIQILKLGEKFVAHGARTRKEQMEFEVRQMDEILDPYNYDIIDVWMINTYF